MGSFKLGKGENTLTFFFLGTKEKKMENLELYSVSDKYIAYLRKTVPNVYSNKEGQRSHTRKYLGIVFKIENYKYYIPLSSPKDSDYIWENGKNVIRKSTLTMLRIISKEFRVRMS
ncbi:MAG: type toxin-antitoxin system ToxN/AbiQ family toxin [Eubacterium sp.]|nr:type toxin-antitoxin system ToxN/AbiQ family toxin [Eubacterium sp.]